MLLLEKQGLCSQQQRQTERCNSLPPSSLPRPKRHHKAPQANKERKLGEYGRLSDTDASSSRKASANSSGDADAIEPKSHRQSPSRSVIARKLGEYNRLNDNDNNSSRNTSSDSTDKSRDSPLPLPPRKLGEYGRLSSDSSGGGKTPPNSNNAEMLGDNPLNTRSSPVRKFPEYSRLTLEDTESSKIANYGGRKLSTGSDKTRESPSRSLLLPPKKLTDYSSCFEAAQQPNKALPLARRGSLRTATQHNKQQPEPAHSVRSLPPPNKYRIQF